ncbi:hypothetical protein Hanom_Chr14g01306921 [Helianthus anomalus]
MIVNMEIMKKHENMVDHYGVEDNHPLLTLYSMEKHFINYLYIYSYKTLILKNNY